jgi:flagellar protein FlaG
MSDQLIGTIKAFAGTNSASSSQMMQPEVPEQDGNTGPSTGNPLPQEESTTAEDLATVAQSLATVSMSIGRDLKFIVDLQSAQPIIQVLDSETGEVIRQIPSSELSTYPLKSGAEGIHLLDTIA